MEVIALLHFWISPLFQVSQHIPMIRLHKIVFEIKI